MHDVVAQASPEVEAAVHTVECDAAGGQIGHSSGRWSLQDGRWVRTSAPATSELATLDEGECGFESGASPDGDECGFESEDDDTWIARWQPAPCFIAFG